MMNMRLKALKRHMFFCHSEHCENQDVEELMDAFKEQLVEAGIHKQVLMNKTSCLGICGNGPFALVYPDGIWYYNLTPEDAQRITMEHFVNNEPVQELVMLKIGG